LGESRLGHQNAIFQFKISYYQLGSSWLVAKSPEQLLFGPLSGDNCSPRIIGFRQFAFQKAHGGANSVTRLPLCLFVKIGGGFYVRPDNVKQEDIGLDVPTLPPFAEHLCCWKTVL
jgi:hypothetical protein